MTTEPIFTPVAVTLAAEPDKVTVVASDVDHFHVLGSTNTVAPAASVAVAVSVVVCPTLREEDSAVTVTLITVLAMVMLAVAGAVEEMVTVCEPVACATPLPSVLGCADAVKTIVVAGRFVRDTLLLFCPSGGLGITTVSLVFPP